MMKVDQRSNSCSYLKQIALICLLLVTGPIQAEWLTEDAAIMGTTIRVEVWHPEKGVRKQGVAAVFEEHGAC